MDRGAAMLILLGVLVGMSLAFLALFAMAPIFCSCIISLLYTLYLFIANETAGIHHAQEFENRFWTVLAVMFSTALFFAKDSPLAFGRWSPSLGFICVFALGYGMHAWDRYVHRKEISRGHGLRRGIGMSFASSMVRLQAAGQLAELNSCLSDIDQLLIPSTINNFINQRFILQKEREIISIFEEADKKALNYLVAHAKLGLLFYKIKDHRSFHGQHRTEFIELLTVERLSDLTVPSRVVVLHALQMMKLPANAKAEYWVRNVILNTRQDDLSELKSLTDSKGDYFSMTKLIFDGIRSETVRQDILTHFRKEAAIQEAHMAMGTKKAKLRRQKAWRKVLSDVDDTLTCSGGSFPAGIDKRYGKKVVYPGVLAFYRELDLGAQGPNEWPESSAGNLVFLSARPHIYKDVSEKQNFAKFEKLRLRGGADGRGGMHTVPSLLAGDVASGREYMFSNDMEPLALKKFENFKQYVSVYPEFQHVFICDNGQGDVRAGELMFDAFPKNVEALYVHIVQDIQKTHGYDPLTWSKKGLRPCFFRTYPEAALNAALRKPPLIRVEGLRRICQDAISDFYMIQTKEWPTLKHKADRRAELNQGLWSVNQFLITHGYEKVPLIEAERLWRNGEKVRTPFGLATILSFDPVNDMYEVELDWRPLDVQVAEYKEREAKETVRESESVISHVGAHDAMPSVLETVVETAEETKEENADDPSGFGGEIMVPKTTTAEAGSSRSDSLAKVSSEAVSPISGSPVWVGDKPAVVERQTSVSDDSPDKSGSPLNAATAEKNGTDGLRVKRSNELDATESLLFPTVEGLTDKSAPLAWSHPVKAKIQGSYIEKFSPPSLPKPPKEGRSIFSFWVGTGEGGKQKEDEFKPGDKCTTPFGPAKVVEYRKKKNIVVVDMIGWKSRGYLRKESVKVLSKGLWDSLLRRLHLAETNPATAKPKPKPKKELEFPYAKGTQVLTPFGEGVISRPLLPASNQTPGQRPVLKKVETFDSDVDGKGAVVIGDSQTATIGIRLTSWELINGRNPTLYCSLRSAEEWKKAKEERPGTGTLLSVVGSLLKRMKTQVESTPVQAEPKISCYERYYKDGASVATPFGYGRVRSFRESDGFYVVNLPDWKLKHGKHPVAFFQRDALSYCLAKGCQEGYPVLTNLGLSGTLASVDPTTGVHVITIPSLSMVCYLQPEEILRPLKAAVAEDVATPYGEGKVTKYRPQDDTYEIALADCGAILYARAETFDRITDGVKDREGPFGMTWLFRYLFFTSSDKSGGAEVARSRSNSISQSIRSQKSGKT